MRRAMSLGLGVCLLTGSLYAEGTAYPDLSGTWVFDADATIAEAKASMVLSGPIFGDEFVAAQTAEALTLKISAGPLRVTAVYALDGSPSKNMSPGAPPIDVTSRARWDGDRLVITSHSESPGPSGPVPVDSTRTVWLDGKGRMLIDRSGTPKDMVPSSRSVYTKR